VGGKALGFFLDLGGVEAAAEVVFVKGKHVGGIRLACGPAVGEVHIVHAVADGGAGTALGGNGVIAGSVVVGGVGVPELVMHVHNVFVGVECVGDDPTVTSRSRC